MHAPDQYPVCLQGKWPGGCLLWHSGLCFSLGLPYAELLPAWSLDSQTLTRGFWLALTWPTQTL